MSDYNSDFVIIAEIPKLSIPDYTSLKIQTLKDIFYLYPNTIAKSLSNINSEISKLLNIPSYQQKRYFGRSFYIEKGTESFTYIASEINIDLSMGPNELFKNVHDHFKPLIILFEFFLRELFTITAVYIFKKNKCGYDFIHMLKRPDFYKELSRKNQLKKIIFIEDVEHRFSRILTRFWGNERYLEYIEEYLTGKLKSFYVNDKLSHYWNSLEHLARRYCKDKDLNKILNDTKLSRINRVITQVLDFLREEDIIFPGLRIEQIRSGNLIRLRNEAPIRRMIFYLCDKLKIGLTDDEISLINIIHFIRGKLFHETYYIMHYAEEISRRYNLENFNLRDFGELSIKFSLLVEKIFMKFFKIIPNYFILNEDNELYHFLINKPFVMPYLRIRRDQNRRDLNESFNHIGLTLKQGQLKRLRFEKKELLRNGRFINILKFMDRFRQNFKELSQNRYFSGLLKGGNRMLEVELKFKDNLEGNINFIFGKRLQIERLIREELKFQSLYNELYYNYGIEFELLLKKVTYEDITDFRSLNTGKFLTLMIDLKKADPEEEPLFLKYLDLYL